MRTYLRGIMAGLVLGAMAATVVYGRRPRNPWRRMLGQARHTLRASSRTMKATPVRLVKLARRYR
ncbi:MAG: hypothetical protein ACP5QO_07765 [Clostridia bacterium]